MGRFNNRRAQERAAQDRNVPSRARFSKGPPSKGGRGGLGGRGGGRDDNSKDAGRRGGRGGRGRRGPGNKAKESIVKKIQDRVQAQRKDIGGISLVSSESTSARKYSGSSGRKMKHPMDGIDVSKLDTITLSKESVLIVERLLRAYDVWDVNGSKDDGKNEIGDSSHNSDGASPMENGENEDDFDNSGIEIQENESDKVIISPFRDPELLIAHATEESRPLFALMHGNEDDGYDEYCGDYEDEPDYGCQQDDMGFNSSESDKRNVSENDSDAGGSISTQNCVDNNDGSNADDNKIVETPSFRHLTHHYSFQRLDAISALKAAHRRLQLSNSGDDDEEGQLLEIAMDWLSLHLDEAALRRGFRTQKLPNSQSIGRSTAFAASTSYNHNQQMAKLSIKAIPHQSLSILPKLTESQYDKERKDALLQWKKQEISTELIRMGFHSKEVLEVLNGIHEEDLGQMVNDNGSSASEREGNGYDSLIVNGEILQTLMLRVESESAEKDQNLNDGLYEELEEAAIIERDQEKEVLEAIYSEGFQLVDEVAYIENNYNKTHHHYRIIVNPTNPLAPPARNDKCHINIITRHGYPLTSSPLLWFTNPTLPPSLLRRISQKLHLKANELIGQAAVFDLMEYLAEKLVSWQKEFMEEESLAEQVADQNDTNAIKSRSNVARINSVNDGDDEEEIDFYSTYYTAEERKKLSRRQRQKLRAVEKSHDRDAILLEKQRVKEQRDQERRERVRIENETVSSRMAERVVETRWKDWVFEEAEKAARKAMNDAFLRDESVENAREIAERARVEVLRFHGEIDDDEKKVDHSTDNVDGGENRPKSIEGNNDLNMTGSVLKCEQVKSLAFDPDIVNGNAGATPKTLLFVEKLRRMYDQKVKEKGSLSCSDSKTGPAVHLLTSSKVECIGDESYDGNTSSQFHVPTPVFSPSPGMDDVLKDILATQRDQPWLIAPEARVPTTTNVDEINHLQAQKVLKSERMKKDEISNKLRIELERKYARLQNDDLEIGRNNSRYKGNNRHHDSRRSSQFNVMFHQRRKLPAYKMRNELLSMIKNNQVTVVSGDTGCGKTTQVPQLVLDDMILNNNGADANIIVTQPRRISAIGVSERIAAERGENIGETVGYSIRLESKRSQNTRLLLCTTGVLLRRLQADPDLASVSAIFVDEVHERDLNTDFLLIILRDLLKRRKSLKLILMSATLNADSFSKYFDSCPVISIPGRAQPVKEYRLEDVLEMTGYQMTEGSDNAKKKKPGDNDCFSKTSLRKMYPNYSKNVINSLAIVDESIINYELIAALLEYICIELEEGAILCFLPGFKEIQSAMEAMSKVEFFQDSSNAVIYPLHSTLSSAEQTAIFDRPPPGKRKIVLSTNIAETSITIDDVVFVVDSARVKESRYDDLNKMPTLVECWVSKASARQRKGRAGRVKPGYCWHLYSTHTYDNEIADYQLPEMLRVGLEDLVLQILVLDLGEPSLFLAQAVDPPTDLSIKNALQLLESLGAAEIEWDSRNAEKSAEEHNFGLSTSLTALGYHLATLPVHPRVGKMMIYGALFGVLDQCLTIAAAMTSRNPFISSFNNRDAADEAKRSFADDDYIAVLLAFDEWRNLRQRDGRKARMFLQDNFLSFMAFTNIISLRKQLSKYVSEIGFVLPSSLNERSNRYLCDDDIHLVRAVIAAGLYPNIIIAPKTLAGKTAGEVSFRGKDGGDVYLHPCTIAFSAKTLNSRYCCFHEIVKTSKIYIRDCTSVSKFALLLFGGTLKVYQTHGVVAVDEWLKFYIDAKPATLVKYLRSSMEALLLEKIMNPQEDVTGSSRGKAVIEAVRFLLTAESR